MYNFTILFNVIKKIRLFRLYTLAISCPIYFVFAVPLVPTPPVKPQSILSVNKIVAFVNKNVITSNQVNMGVQQALLNFKQRGVTPPNIVDIRNKILEQLIMQQIQLDVANRNGIRATDLEIADAINNIIKAQKTTLPELKVSLAGQGISFDGFREQLKNQIILDKLRQHAVDARIVISDDEVNRVLNSEAYKNKTDYNLSLIMIGLPLPATADIIAQKQKIAETAYNQLKSGQSFSEVSAKYSNSPNALSGGELGWKSGVSLPSMISEALKPLTSGQYTSIIRLPMGFFIFKVNDVKKFGMTQIIKQYHVRHILLKVNGNTNSDEALQKIRTIKAELDRDNNNLAQQNLDFIKLAKHYSEDTSSIKGGDLGWLSPGETVPQFDQIIASLPLNKISEPVHTPFGWHIIEVLGVRDSNQTTDLERAAIRKDLRDTKASLMYTEWLRDIRDMAYVKMNDN
jgi:peptidyl-prolyl cis-trans isomerase SurA